MQHKVAGFVGDVTQGVVSCCRCGCELRDDHGYVLLNGEYICRNGYQCSLRQSRNRLDQNKAAGVLPRWRNS